MRTILLLVLGSGLLFLSSCKKKEQKSPQQMLEGKWTVKTSEIMGSVVPGDGSYLQFNACSSTCSGVDHKVSDTTSGTFLYSLNEAATLLNITDTTSNGGSWNGEWDVLDLTETKLRITAPTFLGNLTVEFYK